MYDQRFTLDSPTGAALNVRTARARREPRGILLVQHGLAEHSGRYERFAGEMAALGFEVFVHDHRGHGSTSALDAPLRRFAKSNGAAKVVADAHAVMVHAQNEHWGLPVVVFGHSLGGSIALNFAERHGAELAGVAIWNANLTFGLQERLAVQALKVERALKGSDVGSRLFARATFETWGRSVPGARTPADWLSHDSAAVDAYLSDPLCGFTPTVSMAGDIVELVRQGGSAERLTLLSPDLPLHVLGGSEDPATAKGTAIETLAARLRVNGARRISAEVIAGARHETLNEIELYRAPALASLSVWLGRILAEHPTVDS
ncbi:MULTISPECIES: alpha/beta fold hydrolase [unclassified Aureimonas]|uniref:alpha/beta fold hydrolase n=1 Tax=unclassified Aureimonas TaxID=2615206 RepID=UPI0006F8F865|nr:MULTISPECIES: alpha/beta hydrolase [unclassified Aureimonas]KQT52800.1 lysophospholipase [Aureimonas sp. Leaf427]KQT80259.1 lysophospholipase [Aureimonas sp. Leaf460]